MIREYKTIQEISGPLMVVDRVQGVTYDELGEIELSDGTIRRCQVLEVNGEVRQRGDLDQMIWNVPEILSHLSRWFRLEPGDLIFTGTPAGVGAVQRGDVLQAHIDGLQPLSVRVV